MPSTDFRAVRPNADEFMAYYSKYIDLVPDGDIVEIQKRRGAETLALIKSLSEQQGDIRYAPEKWSIRELIGHVVDAERIFVYRALRFSRDDATSVHGFDENIYAANGPYSHVSMADLGDEFDAVRRATVHFFANLDEQMIGRRGNANGAGISVRALAWIIAGHEIHHVNILKTRYLNS